jgi:RNA polymerase sigma factor (sigma-70 family)
VSADAPASPETPGQVLVRAAMAGDRLALRALWEEHRRWVAAVIMAHKPKAADLDDLLQEVAVSLIAKIHTLTDPAAFPGWLRMVALNAARLAGRKTTVGPRITSETNLGGGTEGRMSAEPASGAAAQASLRPVVSEEARRLFELAMGLPADYREPLLLRTVQELSYQQISAITGLPETTIETRIARGRRMLRELALAQASRTDTGSVRMARAFVAVS